MNSIFNLIYLISAYLTYKLLIQINLKYKSNQVKIIKNHKMAVFAGYHGLLRDIPNGIGDIPKIKNF